MPRKRREDPQDRAKETGESFKLRQPESVANTNRQIASKINRRKSSCKATALLLSQNPARIGTGYAEFY